MNMVLSRWSNRGVNLWKVDLISVKLSTGVSSYSVDPSVVNVLDAYIRTGTAQGGAFILNVSRLGQALLGPVTNAAISASDQTDVLIDPMSRNEYASISNKQALGRPTTFWYDRSSNPTITVWQVPDSGNYTLQYYVCRQIMDATASSGQQADLPYRFLEAFTAALAAHLAVKFAADKASDLRSYADECWNEASDEDREKVTLHLSPQLSAYFN